jgi:hypothetical protein
VSGLVGIAAFVYCRLAGPAFFRKETLTRNTATLVPDE